MLHHVSVGVLNLERSTRFYDAVLGALGFKRVMEFLPYAVAYGETGPAFWATVPHDQKPASVGNGAHVGFTAKSKKAVSDFYEAAINAGAMDEGAPGPRPDYSPDYYGAFVRDPDGNKLEAVFFAGAAPAKAKPKARAKAAKAKTPAKKLTKKAAPKRKPAAKRKTPAARKPTARKPVARRPAPRGRGRPAKR